MGKRLVFIGAGHAHLTAITNLSRYTGDGHTVTVISAGSYHYYSGMGPGLLSGVYTPQEVRFNVKRLTESRGGEFIEDKAITVDPGKRTIQLKNGKTVDYDVVSFNTGSEIATGPVDASYDNIFKVKPVENMFIARCKIMEALKKGPLNIAVIGGGAAGVEMVNNVWRIAADMKVESKTKITMISRGKLLHRFPPRVRKLAVKSMNAKGIALEEDMPVKENTKEKFLLEDGREIPFDFAFVATGTKPSDLFKESGIPTGDDGGLLVNEYLQSIKYPEIFGGGDCISFKPRPLDKVGVYAVRENPILMENLYAALSGGDFQTFKPQEVYLLILNMGDDTGIFNRKSLTFAGKLAFKIKDRIDRKFMRVFQLSNELDDKVECSNAASMG
ncbi:MAG: FAD-dependent oxidoreductase [Candidatus Aminicenantes bacterium]|nr:FAD-dependent oxidoreductase [Candidatus Aminicenantes bacterium]NIM83666.1 FAD-dependent oxidoreductase [Candidatus Aminicenantes bacterium]NIN23090.1 FAD-dependent oxidoreductase [Candidatus Aminicenantes bacterium]NIN46817.1 FAD-dependent oxidoreductase [Candidatus Aminicenantes bacterium]NIN89739.1 FAD-dependent oxidoreductase [Candidatus Aminicenantes bacterium]